MPVQCKPYIYTREIIYVYVKEVLFSSTRREKKKRKMSCLALLTTALVEVKTIYIKTYFSSEQRRQNLRRLVKEH